MLGSSTLHSCRCACIAKVYGSDWRDCSHRLHRHVAKPRAETVMTHGVPVLTHVESVYSHQSKCPVRFSDELAVVGFATGCHDCFSGVMA
jgi:hypothetical protein